MEDKEEDLYIGLKVSYCGKNDVHMSLSKCQIVSEPNLFSVFTLAGDLAIFSGEKMVTMKSKKLCLKTVPKTH